MKSKHEFIGILGERSEPDHGVRYSDGVAPQRGPGGEAPGKFLVFKALKWPQKASEQHKNNKILINKIIINKILIYNKIILNQISI